MGEERIGVMVRCKTCGWIKKPIGRDAPVGWYGCDDGCSGYRTDPRPGSLWPGETSTDFGYPIGTDGTEVFIRPEAPPEGANTPGGDA